MVPGFVFATPWIPKAISFRFAKRAPDPALQVAPTAGELVGSDEKILEDIHAQGGRELCQHLS